MAEAVNPTEEGRRIAGQYLNKRGWARQWRSSLNREIYPAVKAEELEKKERQCDQLESDAEEYLSVQVKYWQESKAYDAKEVLESIYKVLSPRHDLGFYAKRIVFHISHDKIN